MMTQVELYWAIAASALVVALACGLADWRRSRRRNLDAVGWVPWTFIQIIAIIVVLAASAAALH